MEAAQESVHILLRVPILVALARITEIAVVAQLLQILVFDTQQLHQRLIVIDTVCLYRTVLSGRHLLRFHEAENLFQQFPVAEIANIFRLNHNVSGIMARQS